MEFSIEQLTSVAQNIIADAMKRVSPDHATVIGFSGDLGAGKTTMIQEIARVLGVVDDLASPTFVIYKIYSITPSSLDAIATLPLGQGGATGPWKKLIHGDMYRLESSNEIMQLGWEQLIADPENLILIEWPEKIADVIPDWAGSVVLRHVNETTRGVDIR